MKIHVVQIFFSFIFFQNNVWEAAASPAETELLFAHRPADQFPDAPLSKYTQRSRRRLSSACEGRDREARRPVGGDGPWKSPPGGPVEGQRGVGPAHKACLVWDKRRAPGGPYGTIFTIRASLFSLGLRAGACQESSMLAGLKVVLGSGEGRGVLGGGVGGVWLTGWARGFRSSSTSYLTTSVCLMLSGADFKLSLLLRTCSYN